MSEGISPCGSSAGAPAHGEGASAAADIEWHRLDGARELEEDGLGLTYEVGERRVALFRHHGVLHAIDDQCPHRGASLGMGVVLDGEVTCPWHGWHFELATGRNTDGLEECVAVFPLRVTAAGEVEVGLSPAPPAPSGPAAPPCAPA